MSTIGGPNVVDSGLVLELDAGNTKSYPGTGTTWFDKSGYANNGTLINSPTFSTGSGGSIVFDGVDDYISASGSVSLNTFNAFTLSAVVNISSTKTYGAVITKYYIGQGFIWYAGQSSITQRIYIEGTTVGDANTFLTPDVNNYISVTWDGTTIQYYLNAIPDGTKSRTTTVSDTGLLNIGVGNAYSEYWKGTMNIIQIYNRALSAAEIAQNYNALKSRFGL